MRVLLAEGRRAVTISSTPPVRRRRRDGRDVSAPEGAAHGSPRSLHPLRSRPGPGDPAARLSAGEEGIARARRSPLPRQARARPAGRVPPRRERRRARELPPGRGRRGDAVHAGPPRRSKAQAVAARSYALASLVKGKPFDLYSDVRSQVYLGVAGEKPSTTKAVTDTTGRGRPLRREGRDDVLLLDVGGQDGERGRRVRVQRPVPRLAARSVGQDLAVLPVGTGAARRAHGAVEARSRCAGHSTSRGNATPSGRIRSVTVETTTGSEQVPATLVRTALGLRSTWVTIGVLRLDRPAVGAIVFGSSARLTGVGRGLESLKLASSPDGVAWSPWPC